MEETLEEFISKLEVELVAAKTDLKHSPSDLATQIRANRVEKLRDRICTAKLQWFEAQTSCTGVQYPYAGQGDSEEMVEHGV